MIKYEMSYHPLYGVEYEKSDSGELVKAELAEDLLEALEEALQWHL